MQISGLPNLPVVPAQNQRVDATGRLPRETSRSEDERANPSEAALQQLRSPDEENQQQRVDAGNRADETFFRRQAEDEDLPLSTRRALQTFAENTPSPEQQLGIELAGIDTFA